MSSAAVAFHRVILLVCSAMTIVTACAACTVSVKPRDRSNDEAPPTAPVAAAPPPVAAVAAAAAAAPVAAPAQRPTPQPAAAAPVARVSNSRGIGERCAVNSHTECQIGLFCDAFGVCKRPPATRTASSGTFASGHACGLDSLCASGVCLPTPGSAFGKCK